VKYSAQASVTAAVLYIAAGPSMLLVAAALASSWLTPVILGYGLGVIMIMGVLEWMNNGDHT
jgi:hypothetical protein